MEALELSRKHGMKLLEAKALTTLAEVRLALGRPAHEIAEQALAMHREFGCRPWEQRTVALLDRLVRRA